MQGVEYGIEPFLIPRNCKNYCLKTCGEDVYHKKYDQKKCSVDNQGGKPPWKLYKKAEPFYEGIKYKGKQNCQYYRLKKIGHCPEKKAEENCQKNKKDKKNAFYEFVCLIFHRHSLVKVPANFNWILEV